MVKAATDHLIQLDPRNVIAEGAERHVYQHPHDPTRLIKLIKFRDPSTYKRTFGDWTRKTFPSVRDRLIYKEYAEYARVSLHHQTRTDPLPISHMYGFVQTNLGLGCVTEHITSQSGKTGETLKDKCAGGRFTSDDLDLLNTTIAQLYALGVRSGDSNPANFVFGHRHIGPPDTVSAYSCVLVDGFGDFHAIPIRSLSHWTNTLGLDDCFVRMAPKAGLIWNKARRAFARPQDLTVTFRDRRQVARISGVGFVTVLRGLS